MAPTLGLRATRLCRQLPVTCAVVFVCVALGVLARIWGQGTDAALWQMGLNNGEAVRRGEVYRLLACTFLHAGWLHLVMNMSVLMALARLELVLGWRRYVLVYALSGLGGSLATAYFHPEVLSVGASGAIWGVMMASFGVRLPLRHELRASGQRLTGGISMVLVNLAISFLPGVDTTAHLGGGLVGFLAGATFLAPRTPAARQPSPGIDAAFLAGAALAIVLMLGSLAAALATGRPWEFGRAPEMSLVRIGDTPLGIELPKGMGEEVRTVLESDGDWLDYGSRRRFPVALMLTTRRLLDSPDPALALWAPDGAIAGELSERMLDSALEAMQDASPGSTRRTALALVEMGDRRVIREDYLLKDGTAMLRFDQFVGNYRLSVVMWRRDDWPHQVWSGLEERIAASVRYAF